MLEFGDIQDDDDDDGHDADRAVVSACGLYNGRCSLELQARTCCGFHNQSPLQKRFSC